MTAIGTPTLLTVPLSSRARGGAFYFEHESGAGPLVCWLTVTRRTPLSPFFLFDFSSRFQKDRPKLPTRCVGVTSFRISFPRALCEVKDQPRSRARMLIKTLLLLLLLLPSLLRFYCLASRTRAARKVVPDGNRLHFQPGTSECTGCAGNHVLLSLPHHKYSMCNCTDNL